MLQMGGGQLGDPMDLAELAEDSNLAGAVVKKGGVEVEDGDPSLAQLLGRVQDAEEHGAVVVLGVESHGAQVVGNGHPRVEPMRPRRAALIFEESHFSGGCECASGI